MRTPEFYEKRDICVFLDSINAWYFRPHMAGFGAGGVPDIIACIAGRFVAIEVKRLGKEPTVKQARRMTEIREKGGLAVWGTAKKVISELEGLRAPVIRSFRAVKLNDDPFSRSEPF